MILELTIVCTICFVYHVPFVWLNTLSEKNRLGNEAANVIWTQSK